MHCVELHVPKLSKHTHNLLITNVLCSSTDGIDDAVKQFAKQLKDGKLMNLRMKLCSELSPLHIATLCRGLHWSRSLEELNIDGDSSQVNVSLLVFLEIATTVLLSSLCAVRVKINALCCMW